ncbi:MAG: DUF2779 domain-containing protein [Spirochaetes bacterium]|nr:DUF2779 domain-containing protein [Spirochaetota bacterium]
MKKYFTKSLFKKALQCPVKLYYAGNVEYADMNENDPFLEALTEGGFQVGELAKLYFPEGINIAEHGSKAIEKTKELLKRNNITLFEAAVSYGNFFIRTDILRKQGRSIDLIEVKAKSINSEKFNGFITKHNAVRSSWYQYLIDVAFQKYVLSKAYPEYNITVFLMLADKTVKAEVDGLHQRFRLNKDKNGRTSVTVKDRSDTGRKLLLQLNADKAADMILNAHYSLEGLTLNFGDYVNELAKAYTYGRKINHPIGRQCQDCEFKLPEEEVHNKLSGFRECWKNKAGFTDRDFMEEMIFDLWNLKEKQELIDRGIYFIKDVDEDILAEHKRKKKGLTIDERQKIQIRKVRNKDHTPYLDKKGLKTEMKTWKFPLHFIDFESTMTAIPFNKGRRPYEGIAFQFSHHVVYENGRIEHKGQYLNTARGFFPNYDFLRALKKELENDDGSIFRYAAHENSFLVAIHKQMHEDSSPVPDRTELASFIESITHSNDKSCKIWQGKRDMIDLLEIVKKYYYHPVMKGSNSIKAVLPAVLESEYIQKKYSGPVYGGRGKIKSLNFKDQVWIQRDKDGRIISPYKLLPPLFKGMESNSHSLMADETLADGGAAMTAYARMQFTEIAAAERKRIIKGLLRYCELDTLAMVMIYEYFRSIV